MAQISARPTFSQRIHWDDRTKPWLIRLAFTAIGIGIGFYILAPIQTQRSLTYLPETFINLPNGSLVLTNEDGSALLPVRIADNSNTRSTALKDVGPLALNNSFILYAQTRESTATISYSFTDVRVPLELAVINAAGEVLAIKPVIVGADRIPVTEKHRWVLAAKSGTFQHYGVTVGAIVNPESIQKINF